MSARRSLLITAGFVGAFALGLWARPHVDTIDVNRDESRKSASSAPSATSSDARAAEARRVAVTTPKARVERMPVSPMSEELHERLQPLLRKGTKMAIAADGFKDGEQFAALVHASRNLDVNFMVLKDRVLTQKKSLVDFVRSGKGIAGFHCATLTLYNYPEFGEMLGGYYLRSIVPTNRVAQKVGILKVEDQKHPATKMLGASWTINEEFYEFGTTVWDASRPNENVSQVGRLPIPLAFTRDRVHVLLSLDTEKMDVSDLPQIKKGGDYPQAWSREFGKGRIFYTSLGHREDVWTTDQMFRAHVLGGIRYALRLEN